MILLVGAGAVGTILAAHWAAAGRQPLRLLVRERHLEAMQAVPRMRVDYPGRRESLVVPRPETTSTPVLDGVDYLVLCVKYPDLAALLDTIPPVPMRCTVVSALNGVAPLRLVRERLPGASLVPMTVMFNGQVMAPLHARITTKPRVLIGSADATLSASLGGSGMRVDRVEGESAVWGKLLINLANALCALTNSTFRDLLTIPDLRATYVAVLDEAVGVLEARGIAHQLPVPLPYGAYRQFLLHGGPLPWWVSKMRNGLRDGAYPSMVADLERGRRTEVDQLNGEIVRLAEQGDATAPVNARIVDMITAREGADDVGDLSPSDLRRQLRL